MKLLLKYNNSYSNILLFQNPNIHISFMALILWTTKDHALIYLSSLGLFRNQQVVLCSWQFMPNNRIPTQINSITSTWFNLKDSTKFMGKVNKYNHHYFSTSFNPKNLWSSHKTTSIFLRTKHIPYLVQNHHKHHT